jgi:type VI secretion system protein VasL
MNSAVAAFSVLPGTSLPPGGDPRALPAFKALQGELRKLTHPARPDVDWSEVERLCLVVLQHNGVDIQTLACLALARSSRFGVAGALEGVELLDDMLRLHGPRAWPTGAEQRLEILAWLFTHLQIQLRAAGLALHDLPMLVELDGALARLHARLDRLLHVPAMPLHGLRQLVGTVIQRLQRQTPAGSAASSPTVVPRLSPGVGSAPGLRVALGVIGSLGLLWWGSVLWGPTDSVERARYAPGILAAVEEATLVATLAVFRPGSAELSADSTPTLMAALAGIKAQAGRLIVITGHSDASGDVEANLQLSRARAAAVRDWIQRTTGIADNCFAIRGVGASQAFASNDTAAGRTANRRVDIRWVPQEGACLTRVRSELL